MESFSLLQSNPVISNSVNSKSPLFRTKIDFPWIYPYVFSHLLSAISNSEIIRISGYFEHIVLSLHIKSSPLFGTCQKQSTYIRAQLETYCILSELALRNWMTAMMEMKMNNKKKLPSGQRRVRSVKQTRLPYTTVCLLLREPRFDGKQARYHKPSTKVLEKTKNNRTFKDFSMQQHLLIYPI